jgi:cytochrome c oxidase assembly factor CtaG
VDRRRVAACFAAAFVTVAVWAPPLSDAARHYVVFEALQFSLIALVVPALFVLGAPFSHMQTIPKLVGRLAALRRDHSGVVPTLSALWLYTVALILWQIPGVVDATRAHRPLLAVEFVTFVVIGSAFWSELIESRPFVPKLRGVARVGLSVVPMWTVWVLAYFIGFARSSWFPAFRHSGASISTIADQQFATGVLWAVSAAVFLPVIFTNFIRFLSDDEDAPGEIRR